MKSAGEAMEILDAYDLTKSYRAAAALVGCDHHTVRRLVARRDAGLPLEPTLTRGLLIDPYGDKLAEWVARSRGRLRADVAHDKLVAMGYGGSERTTRRAVAEAKRLYRAGHRRVFKPWVPEPGLWFQFDWGQGPQVGGRGTWLWCAWLAWSRFRVVVPVWDRTVPTVIACVDVTLRRFGGAPTHGLTDNERTITVEHIAGVAVRHLEIVRAAGHYGLSIATCVPADPQSKGGSEATVRVAKADLVPTDANLLDDYPAFVDLEAACELFCEQVNGRAHRVTGRPPVELLAAEREHLHPVPEVAYVAAFGQTRSVGRESTISVGGVRYSVPHRLIDQRVWVREHGDELVVVHLDSTHGPVEVARHAKSTKGRPQIRDEHYPAGHPRGGRIPRAGDPEEAAFLALGDGARQWLIEACAGGTPRVRPKMVEALTLARLFGDDAVDRALGVAAVAGRFADGDLAAILDHRHAEQPSLLAVDETHSLQPGTRAWGALGQ